MRADALDLDVCIWSGEAGEDLESTSNSFVLMGCTTNELLQNAKRQRNIAPYELEQLCCA